MHTLTLERTKTKDLALVLLASFVICLSGQLSIPLWFTPIPLATQNATVLFLAALLGARRAGAATFAFLLQGALGLPVFCQGLSGIAILTGPRGGYLIGYLIAAMVVGYLFEKRKNPIAAFAAGNLIIYACGASYLATFVGVTQAFLLGIAPFILGDLLKATLSLKLLQWIKIKNNL